tara:strand:- start:305 stop:574 length:270 start_codon:yes stop_codon:yes gene_type:complete
MKRKLEYIGFIAAILGTISFYSLVYHNYNLQDTTSISPYWLVMSIIIQILWLIFGISNNIRPTIVSAPLVIIGLVYLIYLKLKLETDII